MADTVLFAHAAFVAFVTGGLVAIGLGPALGWGWVRNRRFRQLHLTAIAFVALQAVAGLTCPLTLWEDALRGRSRPGGFIADWVSRLLYWDLPAWAFIAVYCAWAGLTLLAWRWVPPRASAAAQKNGAP